MGAIMEAVFCVLYLVATFALGGLMLAQSKGNPQRRLFAALTITLVAGDSFHLVPRIYGNLTGRMAELTAALGFGTLVTSITMTAFYVLLYHFWNMRNPDKGLKNYTIAVYAFAFARVIACAAPGNGWLTGVDTPLLGVVPWGVMRNVPFAALGAMLVWLFAQTAKGDKPFRHAWLAITLSFAFYALVVLFADAYPIMGMFMLPKTVCYVWLVIMGYNGSRQACLSATKPQNNY